ncbi:uncharacterized protein EV422DRAFT_175702 [Fimicolochytrium jonesii]|uniref:uncharacterized protein n=1 Tax=Fimicolochytrium jonesii TaxID=1396493 RepID=UPI0022FE8AAF|nr:uncharacterized protein EV422DRAFT_175702 [Fimicolochytrium jonesii]KAI8818628.1 hypothetical protein EV422DRAFT_175702 [Fimicolochytrium jonesii]
MATLTRARVGIQFPANNDLLTRVTDRKLCFKPPTAEGKDPQPREIYVDCLFREDDTPAKMAASFELDKLVSRVLNGYRAGLFVAASGRRFSATRTHVFAEALSILGRSLSEASDVSLSYAYVALTDAKCLDLTGDRVIDARGNKAALEPIYRPFSDCHDLLRVVQGGSSLPYALMIRVEKFGGARTMGSLLLCDLGLPTFDNSISEDSIRRLGPSLSLSFRTLQKIIFMKSTAGVEGPLPYHESNLTLICKDYLDGHAAMKFVLCLDASADVNQQEITGALNFAESLRKFQTLEQPTEVDPRISGLEADRKAFADEAKVLAATLREAERAHKKAARLSAEKHGRLVQGLRQELALALKAAEEQHQKDTQKLENELQTAREENSAAFQKASDSWADDKRAIIADFDTKMQALEENVEDERKVLNLKLANTKLTSDAALSKNASEMAALQELLRQEKVHLLHQTEQTTFSEAARYALEKELEFVKENLAREEETNTESTETLSALQVAHEALARDLILEKETRAGLESSLAEREQKADELSTEIHTVQEKLNVTLQQLEEVTAKLAAMTEASKEMDGQFAEQTIAIHEKQSSIAVLEARFQEAREMTEQMRNERDSARLEIAGATSRAAEVVEIMRDEIRSVISPLGTGSGIGLWKRFRS